ncbi:energy transducer TonB [Paraburkholderia sp. BCC1885]|uniref:energy transducer TonB n=1 Tax=Paraburkholderia sp. BCC1885 TaxID=2562669 RepID=UPI0021B1D90C|nr:energy transducer TonB [Paraburkholderia sp. BCC1885]
MNTFHRAAPERAVKTSAYRVVAVATLVLAAHVGLLVIALSVQDRPVEKPVESRTITASLLSETPTPVVTPATLQSSAPPQPVPPNSYPKPRPVEHHVTVRPTPFPGKPSDVPSPISAAATEPAPAPAAQAAAPAAAPAAPAINRATLAISAPKDVAHLDCNIAKPDYPYLSKRTNETGTAVIRFVVGLTGTIEEVRLQKSSGFARLDSAALDAMHASACHPYMEDGKPVRATYSQPFTFSLAD